MTWTEERTEELKRLWRDGLSAGDIARTLGGTTRNAVLGKIWRMNGGKPSRGPSWRPSVKKPPKPVTKPVAVKPLPKPVEPPPEPRLLTCLELTHHTCKWPYGDPRLPGFGFCGHAVEFGSPYCPHHAAVSTRGVG